MFGFVQDGEIERIIYKHCRNIPSSVCFSILNKTTNNHLKDTQKYKYLVENRISSQNCYDKYLGLLFHLDFFETILKQTSFLDFAGKPLIEKDDLLHIYVNYLKFQSNLPELSQYLIKLNFLINNFNDCSKHKLTHLIYLIATFPNANQQFGYYSKKYLFEKSIPLDRRIIFCSHLHMILPEHQTLRSIEFISTDYHDFLKKDDITYVTELDKKYIFLSLVICDSEEEFSKILKLLHEYFELNPSSIERRRCSNIAYLIRFLMNNITNNLTVSVTRLDMLCKTIRTICDKLVFRRLINLYLLGSFALPFGNNVSYSTSDEIIICVNDNKLKNDALRSQIISSLIQISGIDMRTISDSMRDAIVLYKTNYYNNITCRSRDILFIVKWLIDNTTYFEIFIKDRPIIIKLLEYLVSHTICRKNSIGVIFDYVKHLCEFLQVEIGIAAEHLCLIQIVSQYGNDLIEFIQNKNDIVINTFVSRKGSYRRTPKLIVETLVSYYLENNIEIPLDVFLRFLETSNEPTTLMSEKIMNLVQNKCYTNKRDLVSEYIITNNVNLIEYYDKRFRPRCNNEFLLIHTIFQKLHYVSNKNMLRLNRSHKLPINFIKSIVKKLNTSHLVISLIWCLITINGYLLLNTFLNSKLRNMLDVKIRTMVSLKKILKFHFNCLELELEYKKSGLTFHTQWRQLKIEWDTPYQIVRDNYDKDTLRQIVVKLVQYDTNNIKINYSKISRTQQLTRLLAVY